MIKRFNQYIKEHLDIDPFGEEDWDDEGLSPVLMIARKQGIPFDQITRLDCDFENLTSLEGIETLTNLEKLILTANELTNLEGIEKLTNLQYLYCGYNNLTSLKGIEKLINLKELYCFDNQLTNLNGIENLTNIQSLSCYNNQLTSLEWIENLTNLKELDCSSNDFSIKYINHLKDYCKNKNIKLDI